MYRTVVFVAGLVAFSVLSYFAVVNVAPQIEGDLQLRANAALDGAGLSWARADFSGRGMDMRLSGQASSAEARDQAIAVASQLTGVHLVENAVIVAGEVQPEAMSAAAHGGTTLLRAELRVERLAPGADESEVAAPMAIERAAIAAVSNAGVSGIAEPYCNEVFKSLPKTHPIRFHARSAGLLRESMETLRHLAESAKACPEMGIIIGSHVNRMGDPDFDIYLSQLRGNSVANGLHQYGVDGRRLRVYAYGSSHLIVESGSADDMANNERIEFILVKPGT